MNRWIGKVVLFASLSAPFLAGSGLALAQSAATAPVAEAGAAGGHHGHHHREGLLGRALKLDSLTSDQRSQIEQLVESERTAHAPVRAADAAVLTALAQQVESGTINETALAPTVQARQSAEATARSSQQGAVVKLHAILTPTQRGQLVDAIEAAMASRAGRPHGGGDHNHGMLSHLSSELGLSDQQTQQIASTLRTQHASHANGTAPANAPPAGTQPRQAWLESFRGDAFSPTPPSATPGQSDGALAVHAKGGMRMEHVLEAAVPVLTSAQRTELATLLRARAAHESRG
ncbi:MAG TPA: Spy/CpxP family protein refolding chaperone [Polyangiaceae bacterium]|jgi:Spy/CpxP family protein refolding chaperone|nr:Spy/CpxP family protein refolding chaperone [Polyangiaceae bacterium]